MTSRWLSVLRRGEIRTWNRDELRNSGDDPMTCGPCRGGSQGLSRVPDGARWGDIDEAALYRFLAGCRHWRGRESILRAMVTHPELREWIETVREVYAR